METSVASKLIPKKNNFDPGLVENESFTEKELEVIENIDGARSISRIAQATNTPVEEIFTLMLSLLKEDLIKFNVPDGDKDFLGSVFDFLKSLFQEDEMGGKYNEPNLEEFDPEGKTWGLIDQLEIEMGLESIEEMAAAKRKPRHKAVSGSWNLDSLFQFINNIHQEKKTGRLQVKGHGKEVKNLFFQDGELWNAFSKPFRPEECLGRILQRAGKLENAEVIASLKSVLKTGNLQGEELVLMGKIHSGFLKKSLRFQIETKLKLILEWGEGTYSWLEVKRLPKKIANIDISLPSIFFNMLWKYYPEKEIIKQIRKSRYLWVGKNHNPPYKIEDFSFGGIFTRSFEIFAEKDVQVERAQIISNLRKDQTPKMIWILKKLEMILFLEDTRADKSEMRVEELKEKLKYAEKLKYFALLGVHWSANDQMINKGYNIAKSDIEKKREKAEGAELALLEELMRHVETAYDTLHSHKKRMEFRSKIFDDSIIETNSEIFRQKAESFLFTKDEYAEAIAEAESALEIYEDDPESYAVLGLAKFLLAYPRDTKVYEEGRELMNRSREMAPKSEMVNMCLGMMYRRENMHDRSMKFYKKVLEVNPGNKFARIEIREIETGEESETEDRKTILKEFLDQRSDIDKKFDDMMKKKK